MPFWSIASVYRQHQMDWRVLVDKRWRFQIVRTSQMTLTIVWIDNWRLHSIQALRIDDKRNGKRNICIFILFIWRSSTQTDIGRRLKVTAYDGACCRGAKSTVRRVASRRVVSCTDNIVTLLCWNRGLARSFVYKIREHWNILPYI